MAQKHKPSGVPSLNILCGDGRLKLRFDELYDYYWWLDGVPPYTMMNAGAGVFADWNAGRALLLQNRLFFENVGHVRIDHHMGTEDLSVAGCAQYRDLYERYGTDAGHVPGIPYPPSRELLDHQAGLEAAAQAVRDYYEDLFEAGMPRRAVTITTSLYRLEAASGKGKEEIITTERELPPRCKSS